MVLYRKRRTGKTGRKRGKRGRQKNRDERDSGETRIDRETRGVGDKEGRDKYGF